MEGRCRNKKVDWGAIMKSKDAGSLDYGRNNEGG